MDREDLSPALLRAGHEYLEGLRRLRLEPEGLLWARCHDPFSVGESRAGYPDAYDASEIGSEWRLVLVTSIIDETGPLILNELLFKAYDASATPREISPFNVEVIAANTPFVDRMLAALNGSAASPVVEGLRFDRKWVYQLPGLAVANAGRKPDWRTFQQSVNALAA